MSLSRGTAGSNASTRTTRSTGRRSVTANEKADGDAHLWLSGQVLGTATFAGRLVRVRQREVEADMERGHADALPALAAQVARRFGIARSLLPGRGRARVVSRARRALIEEAVLRRGIRPVDLSRHLGISAAAVAQHLRVLEREK